MANQPWTARGKCEKSEASKEHRVCFASLFLVFSPLVRFNRNISLLRTAQCVLMASNRERENRNSNEKEKTARHHRVLLGSRVLLRRKGNPSTQAEGTFYSAHWWHCNIMGRSMGSSFFFLNREGTLQS